jgi:hypothetical protein
VSLDFAFGLPGDGPVFFAAVTGVDVAADGGVVVGDALNKTIYRFSPTGTFLDSLGREGRGPGEFGHPTAVAAGPRGEMAVADARAARVTVWAADGRIIQITRHAGHPVGLWWNLSGLHLKAFPLGHLEPRVSFYRLTPGAESAGPPVVSLPLVRDLRRFVTEGLTCEYCPATVALDGDPIVADPDPKSYRLVQVNPAGHVVRMWERPGLPPVRFTSEELGKIRAALARVGDPFDPERFAFAPRIMAIDLDEEGRLWVLRRSSGGASPALDVFGGDTRLLAEVAVPGTTRQVVVRRGRVLLTGTSEDDEPVVWVYRVRAPGDASR